VSQPWPPPPNPSTWTSPAAGSLPPTNGVATAALIIGILALLPAVTIIFAFLAVVPGVVAIVLGGIGLSNANRRTGGIGKGSAITGIICGILTFVALAIEITAFVFLAANDEPDIVNARDATQAEYEIQGQTCRATTRDLAESEGVLINRSGEPHAFTIAVRFVEDGVDMGTDTDQLAVELADGASWAWQTQEFAGPNHGTVTTEHLDCQIASVQLGEIADTDDD
jgi:hypothetical protein